MSQIVPAITVETVDQYKVETEKLSPFARRVHVDITDGEFAPTFLLSEQQLYWPEAWEVDVHAMVMRPSEHIEQIIALTINNDLAIIFTTPIIVIGRAL